MSLHGTYICINEELNIVIKKYKLLYLNHQKTDVLIILFDEK